ncbi:protein of unknown function UPF0047 [Magnetococcus marinus MC-1]|uniref:Secondary thiamine-phosphate synthase enzyme n=1 Tax=Magnetococcus marinus (strain ATCC BAA-1437 / JCM 17883 / MC-1) TaxID=156889 RepID=A0LDU0_MAGMM|nr:secondary thiamine-phosphate synthase enzyme YjbQ [Magnetococcus marinus]ABK46133.1 protein of unknown function UPF0047 [Magnetococcus marinus MC-1]
MLKRHVLAVNSGRAQAFIDITDGVNALISKAKMQQGLCHLFVPHTTAGITVNENCDPDVARDILATLDQLVPIHGNYRHAEGNSHAHLKASLMGHALSVPIEGGKLLLGTWQGLYFTEFDGPRARKVILTLSEG